MAEELQSLLNRINQDGIQKAEAERDRIIGEANEQARKIVAEAKSEAEKIRQIAQADAEAMQKRGASAIEQASRDVLLSLKSELERRLRQIVGEAADQTLTPEYMAALIKEMALKFAASPDAELTVLTAIKDVDKLEKTLKSTLADSFKKQPEVFPDKELKGGFKVNISGSEVYYDLSDSAVLSLVCDFIGPKLAAMLKK